MARYIDADRLIKELYERKKNKLLTEDFINGIRAAISIIEWTPTANVVEVTKYPDENIAKMDEKENNE